MADLKLDPASGTLARKGGDLCLTDDSSGETVAQRLRVRLRLFLGEWFLDTRKGVPYRESILVRNPDMAAVESALVTIILDTPGVARLLSFSSTLDAATRHLAVSFEAEADSGDLITIDNEVLTP